MARSSKRVANTSSPNIATLAATIPRRELPRTSRPTRHSAWLGQQWRLGRSEMRKRSRGCFATTTTIEIFCGHQWLATCANLWVRVSKQLPSEFLNCQPDLCGVMWSEARLQACIFHPKYIDCPPDRRRAASARRSGGTCGLPATIDCRWKRTAVSGHRATTQRSELSS